MDEPQVTILHIDDNEANRYIVTRILQRAGFTALEAATGTAGLDAVIQQQPDLVILDVQLPDLSGFEVCRQIKANPATAYIPVLHLSASFVQSQDKAEGLDSGADGYLAQPVEPIELLATVRSLLRIRQAEASALASAQDWQTTFDSIHDSVGLLDREGKILRCNRAMSQLFGQSANIFLGCAHHEVMQAELGIGDGSCFRRAQETQQRQVLELQANGRWFAKTVDPVLDEQGLFAGAVFILSDITNRKQAEALLQEQHDRLQRLTLSLQEQTKQAQQANRVKDEFLAVLSHELRSPLNPILGWARILRTSSPNEARTQYALETIERNAKLQAELIEDLLDISRILQGKLHLKTSPVGLSFIIKAALETVRLAAEAKAIQIQTFFEPDMRPVQGDANRLQQVVWNLLANAVKFTPSGGKIEVRLESSELADSTQTAKCPTLNSYAQITVRDNGNGIPLDFVPYVFDYFRQADSTTTRKFGGLGLGLAIVRYLVELHGGTVQAASPGEGQGATFTVRLPIIAAAIDDANVASDDPPDFDFNGLQVLLVDDDQDSRTFIAFLLEQYGAEVTEADSASKALSHLAQANFALLISDIGMPEMDGYRLIEQIRQQTPDQGGTMPAIALTAYAGELDRQQALAAGFQQHLAKPVEAETLMHTVLGLTGRDGHV